MSTETIAEQMKRLKVCVIIPTYNNHKTLQRVLNGVLERTDAVIVVNDGSTDNTLTTLSDYQHITQIHLPQNKGKGNALRHGFLAAKRAGYEYAITIDSDGQHFPEDIVVFLKHIDDAKAPILLIGSRDMTSENVPKKSSFGHKFSNFWYHFETGVKLSDTQSGYRSYPLNAIPKRLFTQKFELEIEVIVRSSWKGVEVKNIPVNILYDPEERVSHFRPFKDFTRISLLNVVLVMIALVYIKPRDFVLNLKKKSFKDFIREDVLGSSDSKLKKSLSIALGVFIGISPFWGFQTVIVLSLAVVLKLNKVLAFAFSNVSFPPFIPFIIIGSLQMGKIFIKETQPLVVNKSITFDAIADNLTLYLVGSFILATTISIIAGFTSYFVLSIRLKKYPKTN